MLRFGSNELRTAMPEVPYYTIENEAEPCGHIWRQRDRIGRRWGFQWEVIEP